MSPARADGPDRPQGKAAAADDGAGPAARDEGGRAALAEALEREARRRAAADAPGAFWRDLSVAGGLGWLVAAPTLAAAALGRWLDLRLGAGVAFSAGMIMLGASLGGWLAWRRVRRAQRSDRAPDARSDPARKKEDDA